MSNYVTELDKSIRNDCLFIGIDSISLLIKSIFDEIRQSCSNLNFFVQVGLFKHRVQFLVAKSSGFGVWVRILVMILVCLSITLFLYISFGDTHKQTVDYL